MGKIQYIQTAFNSGEFSPQLEGRVDIKNYASGCSTLENMLIRPYGGTYRRPGTYYVASTKYSSHPTRLIPFQFSITQAYIIEVGDKYMRFYKDGAQITHTGGAVEISTPYDKTDIFSLQFAQSADTLYISHNSYHPAKVTRTSHTSWSHDLITFSDGPYMDDNSNTTHTIWLSSVTGNVTVYSSTAYFEAGHSGSLLRIGTSDGYVKITTVTNSQTVSATVIKEVSSTAATNNWAIGAWNPKNGYPAAVTFHEQRLFFAGSLAEPQRIWGSVSEDYENMLKGSADSDAILYTISDDQVNAILWLKSAKALVIGSSSGTHIADSDTSSGPITPSNIRIPRATNVKAANVVPKRINNFIYYIQYGNRKIIEHSYNFADDRYSPSDMNLLSEHITDSGITDIDYQESPDSVLWCVRTDGVIACMTRQIDQQVIGWSRQKTQGTFKSVAMIPNGEEDQVWTIVRRVVNSAQVQYIEYFKPFILPSTQHDAYFVDCGLTYDSATTAGAVSGLDHLEGCTVSVLADGAVQPDATVSGGAITLSRSANVVHVGLSYTSNVTTLRLEGGSAIGTAQGLIKRIIKATVRLYRSLGCQIGDGATMDTVYFRDSSMAMDSGPSLFTGDKTIQFTGGWEKEGKIYITQSQPLPLNLLCGIFSAEIADEF